MSQIDIPKLQSLCQMYEDEEVMNAHFKKFRLKYKLKLSNDLPSTILEKVIKTNNKLTNKNQINQEKHDIKIIESFGFGELQIFTWILSLYCYKVNLYIEELSDQHFQEIRAIFKNKSPMFIKYQTMCLAYQKTKYAPAWTQQEIQQMTSIIKSKQNLSEWRQISYQLYCTSKGKYFRPFQQCREKWFNHLDPKVRKGKWTIQEDIALLSSVQCLDCKWIQICRELGGTRTEHMIKNRYKSLMKKWKKKYEKTSPKKIVSLVLKHLKNKMKKGDLNSSMSSNEHQEVPVPKNQLKKTNKKDKKDKKEKVEEKKNEKEVEVFEEQKVEKEKESFYVEEEINESQFDLGFNQNFSYNWKTSIKLSPENEDQRQINAIVERQDDYFDVCKVGQERKTSDEDEEVTETKQKTSTNLSKFSLEDEMYEVAGFQNIEMIQPQSEWLKKLEEKWQVEDFDDMFGY